MAIPATGAAQQVVDPVCGMHISPDSAAGHEEHRGTTYYFCSQGCHERFTRTPEAYVSPAEGGPARPAAGSGATHASTRAPWTPR